MFEGLAESKMRTCCRGVSLHGAMHGEREARGVVLWHQKAPSFVPFYRVWYLAWARVGVALVLNRQGDPEAFPVFLQNWYDVRHGGGITGGNIEWHLDAG